MNRFSIIFEGRVQAVGFRYFAFKSAQHCRLTGFARNLRNGNVEVEVQGSDEQISLFLGIIREGNGYISVSHYSMTKIDLHPDEQEFSIRY